MIHTNILKYKWLGLGGRENQRHLYGKSVKTILEAKSKTQPIMKYFWFLVGVFSYEISLTNKAIQIYCFQSKIAFIWRNFAGLWKGLVLFKFVFQRIE